MHEALDDAGGRGHPRRRPARARFPVRRGRSYDFIADHETVFVVEQNRDAQLRMMLINEQVPSTRPSSIPVLHYDGTPITARFITDEISRLARGHDVHFSAPSGRKKGLAP